MSATAHARLRAWLISSGLGIGGRLPPERDLCTMLGFSRAELRKGLLVLEAEGLLQRQVGRGTFLARLPGQRKAPAFSVSIANLAEQTGPHEAMIARMALEPELARLAAMHATPQQIRGLRSLSASMRRATRWSNYEELDLEFHNNIAEAAGNSLLHEVHKIVNGVRLLVVWRRLDTPLPGPSPDYHSFDEHEVIVDALEKRSGAEAHAAMLKHLETTLATMTASLKM